MNQPVVVKLGSEAGKLESTVALLVAFLFHFSIWVRNFQTFGFKTVIMLFQNMPFETLLVFEGFGTLVAFEVANLIMSAHVCKHLTLKDQLPALDTRQFLRVNFLEMEIQRQGGKEHLIAMLALPLRVWAVIVVNMDIQTSLAY